MSHQRPGHPILQLDKDNNSVFDVNSNPVCLRDFPLIIEADCGSKIMKVDNGEALLQASTIRIVTARSSLFLQRNSVMQERTHQHIPVTFNEYGHKEVFSTCEAFAIRANGSRNLCLCSSPISGLAASRSRLILGLEDVSMNSFRLTHGRLEGPRCEKL